jgi:hypothetical protein
MSNYHDTSPAFPYSSIEFGQTAHHPGMELRDYFAAQVIASTYLDRTQRNNKYEAAILVAHAYMVADIMLEERIK